jgi:prophage antirepressor-like protein
MMRKRDGLVAEQGFHELLSRAKEHVAELMAAFATEAQHGVRCWLLELIGEARSEQAFELLCEQAQSAAEAFRSWAVRGLQLLDTHAARKFLFDHGFKA